MCFEVLCCGVIHLPCFQCSYSIPCQLSGAFKTLSSVVSSFSGSSEFLSCSLALLFVSVVVLHRFCCSCCLMLVLSQFGFVNVFFLALHYFWCVHILSCVNFLACSNLFLCCILFSVCSEFLSCSLALVLSQLWFCTDFVAVAVWYWCCLSLGLSMVFSWLWFGTSSVLVAVCMALFCLCCNFA